MLLSSNYELNVTCKNEHICKIELGQISERSAYEKFDHFADMFWNYYGDDYIIELRKCTCHAELLAERRK
jgi:hypothetical protein